MISRPTAATQSSASVAGTPWPGKSLPSPEWPIPVLPLPRRRRPPRKDTPWPLDALDDGDETIELITLQGCDVDEIADLLARLEDFLLHDDDYTADHVSQLLINDRHDGSPAGRRTRPSPAPPAVPKAPEHRPLTNVGPSIWSAHPSTELAPERARNELIEVPPNAGLMIDSQDVRLDLLVIASVPDCPLRAPAACQAGAKERRGARPADLQSQLCLDARTAAPVKGGGSTAEGEVSPSRWASCRRSVAG